MMATANPTAIAYKQVGDLTLYVDVYPPTTESEGPVPVVVFFHGGGMSAGDSKSWLPTWLSKRTTAAGLAFVSADYRLIPPCTGHDILDDIVDLFAFLARTELLGTVQIDSTRLAVAGTSAGGMCAFLAAVHVKPKPRAVLSMYGLGGDIFSPHLLSLKTKPFFMGYDLLDPTQFTDFIYPESSSLAPVAQSPPSYFGPDSATPGLPSNPRTLLSRLWLQSGTYLDYWTGLHEPSISAKLRELLPAEGEDITVVDARLAAALPASEHAIFPQLLVNSEWPPVLLIHGSEDSAVLAPSSRTFHTRLLNAKVQSALRIVEGSEHSFDLRRGAEEKFGALFDEAAEFLRAALLDA